MCGLLSCHTSPYLGRFLSSPSLFLRIEDMVRSRWVYRKLRNFRAGIEAGISCLKRTYGLARCTW
ncbi:hypothetical protein SAMN04244575_06793, partial [Sinorhizobium meliloti]